MHPSRTRIVLTALIGLLAVLAAGLVLATPANAADTDVRINEVSSNPNPDSVELINTGSAPVDISAWKMADSDHAPIVFAPAGTILAPGGYYAFNPDATSITGHFGLGAADSFTLFNGAGTQIDSYSWLTEATHRTPSASRCPNGSGSFLNGTPATPGAANTCPAAPDPSAVKINEVSSNPNPDSVELINTAAAAIDISGWKMADSDHASVPFAPAGTTIPAGGYYVFNPDATTITGHFGLGAADSITIFTGAGAQVDSYSWLAEGTHRTPSASRCPNGSGAFLNGTPATPGAANSCPAAIPNVKINEVESNGDLVADWVELKNNGASAVNVSGWKILDNDPAHVSTPVVVPANTTIPAGGYYAIYTEIGQTPGFGLGGADSASLFLPDGTTQVDTYSWTAHAATTYGRCPDGTGAFTTTTTSTRGLANACSPIRINEVESNGDPVGDWVELKNISGAAVNIGGWVFKDNDNLDSYVIPAGTTIAAGSYQVLDVADFVFGLGGSDQARLFDASSNLIDTYTWTAHATQTYGRCKDGLGDFVDTKAPTKGAANSCPGLDTLPWPGGQTVSAADLTGTFVQDLSGLVFDPADPDVLWAAQNKKGTLFKLVRDPNNNWVPAAGWPRDPKFANGQGSPDTEGITVGPDGFVYLTTERDNDASGISRNTILRFDPNSPAGATITPTTEWNLTPLLPSVGANLGLEGVTFVPDSYLLTNGFKDQSTGATYSPSTYPAHGSGLFFVAYENNGSLYAFALDSDGTPHLVATIPSGFSALADVDFDPELGRLRAVTDDTVDGKTSVLKIDASGNFVVDKAYDRPAGMPNINNEGLAIAPQSRCVNGVKEALWSDDGDTDGHSIRRGTINCTPPAAQVVTFTTPAPSDARVGQNYVPSVTGGGSGNPVVLSIAPASADVCSLALGVVMFNGAGTCTINANQAAAQGYLAGAASQSFAVTKADQSITFAQPGNTVYGGASVPLSASASSGLSVTFTSETPSVCVIDGATAKPVGAGTCTITASQSGNDVYAAAAPVSRSLTVAKAPIALTTKSTSGLLSLLTFRVTYTSTVKSAVTGLPVAGVPVTTRVNGGSPTTGCTATTNASGIATCVAGPINIQLGILVMPYTATAAATANHLAGSAAGGIPLL